ncbi:ABC transporter permease, partial [Actinotalea sp. K2]|uniref:ABC transporter permease n=1 Tax=Actinotalea sp. K2 TaxID=2939438 RepID=UPI0020178370
LAAQEGILALRHAPPPTSNRWIRAEASAPVTTDGIPFLRLVRVELRKMVDTRAGRWLLIGIGAVTLAVVVTLLFVREPQDLTMSTFLAATTLPQSLLLPLLGVMAVTSEWGQRTALVTFTLEPRRLRVLLAKLVGSLVLGAIAIAVAFAFAALATGLGELLRDGAGQWHVPWSTVGGLTLSQLLLVAQGVGFGLLFANTATAIVAYLVLPMAWGIVGAMVSSLETAAAWLDLSQATFPLVAGQMTGEYWAQLLTAVSVWVLLPIAAGTWRLVRREVK